MLLRPDVAASADTPMLGVVCRRSRQRRDGNNAFLASFDTPYVKSRKAYHEASAHHHPGGVAPARRLQPAAARQPKSPSINAVIVGGLEKTANPGEVRRRDARS